jgi:adenylate cyclase
MTMRRFSLSHLLEKTTLRANILAIFLFLLAATALTIIGFTYWRGFRSIYRFSTAVIEQVSNVIVARVDEITTRMEQLAENTVSLLPDTKSFSFDNQALISYMLSVIKTEQYLYGLYVGTPQGSLLEAVDLAAAYQTHFIFNPKQPLPKESAYVLRFLDRSQPHVRDVWTYKNQDLQTIATEFLDNPASDPRTRSWYQGAIRSKKEVFWTPVYNYDPLGEPGITVAKAIFAPSGEPIAAVGVDMSLNLLGRFLTEQKIGTTGRAFILNTSGQVIIPSTPSSDDAQVYGKIPKGAVAEAYQRYAKTGTGDLLFRYNGVQYLASVDSFPVTGEGDLNWIVLIVAPMKEFLSDLVWTQYQVLSISLAIFFAAALLVAYFAKQISVPIVLLANETAKLKNLDFKNPTRVHSHIYEIILMDDAIDALRLATKSFSRYIPKEIVHQLIDKGRDLELGGEKKVVTTLFSDIDGFTSVAENNSVETVMELLTGYFGLLSNVILQHRGNIDKYIGDAIMAIWGAPLEIPHPEEAACRAALECQEKLVAWNRRNREEGRPVLPTRIGIDTGEVVVGNIGTEERMNYTAIGHSVNRAARLEVANKTYRTTILVSESVAQRISPRFVVRPLDRVELKGLQQKTKIFELMGEQGKVAPEIEELARTFTAAFEAFQRGEGVVAKQQLLALKERFPDDYPTQLLLSRT